MRHAPQRFSRHARGFRQGMVKSISDALGIIPVRMAKSDDEAYFFFLELTVTVNDAIWMDYRGFFKTNRARIESNDAADKAENGVVYF